MYEELRQALKFEVEKDKQKILEFVKDIPKKLQEELSVRIHSEIILQIPFF